MLDKDKEYKKLIMYQINNSDGDGGNMVSSTDF